MCIEQYAELSREMLTPLIAIITVYIAWQQWQTNKKKLFLDLYDRRLKIYEEVRQILSVILRDARASYDDLMKFRRAVSEADFLFGSEITNYIDEIYQRGVKLEYWNREYRDYTQLKPENYDHLKICEAMHSEVTWLTAQFEPARQKFKKYLDLHDGSYISKIRYRIRGFFH